MTNAEPPAPVHLALDDPDGVQRFLGARHWLPDGGRVTGVTRAGEGNMNLVLRVAYEAHGEAGTLILKQARPWVEKYPQIAAPPGRLAVEADFYRALGADPALAARMPALCGVDESAATAWLEDLGDAADHLGVYRGDALPAADLDALLDWLARLHALPIDPARWPRLSNREMRALNHAHIFVIPLAADGPAADDFCPGLGRIARALRADATLARRLTALGDRYLADGTRLLHGDFYPGSWLRTADGPRVIDPEFGFLGCPEFDLGVLIAHLHFAGHPGMELPAGDAAASVLSAYVPPPGFDPALARAFAGAELVRRLLGVAQLPLDADLAQRERWLETGRALLLD